MYQLNRTPLYVFWRSNWNFTAPPRTLQYLAPFTQRTSGHTTELQWHEVGSLTVSMFLSFLPVKEIGFFRDRQSPSVSPRVWTIQSLTVSRTGKEAPVGGITLPQPYPGKGLGEYPSVKSFQPPCRGHTCVRTCGLIAVDRNLFLPCWQRTGRKFSTVRKKGPRLG